MLQLPVMKRSDVLFPSKKEFEQMKEDLKNLSDSHNRLVDTVIKQQAEIAELKKPKEPEYFG